MARGGLLLYGFFLRSLLPGSFALRIPGRGSGQGPIVMVTAMSERVQPSGYLFIISISAKGNKDSSAETVSFLNTK